MEILVFLFNISQRRRDGIFKDRYRTNKRRIKNGLPPLPDDQFDNPQLVEEYKDWKRRNNIKD